MRSKHLNLLFRRGFGTKSKSSHKNWESVVGLEIHAQISTESKLFSGAPNAFGKPPNSCVSFFDCATPGTLPVLNSKCVEAGILTSLALSCKINEISLFDRKHYFYADLPTGYQITQQRQPLAIDGYCEFYVFNPSKHKEPYLKISRIKQIQLEQDSGKSIHDESLKRSLIDLNRAGVPLMELVFEPDLKDGEEAAALVKELTSILRKLKTCSCKMEEGALRVDANISINRPGEPLGVRTEVKNISSFRGVAKAIDFEIARQIEIRENGGQIVNETRTWDAESDETLPMRDKEEKQDYRFMPEPNLPPLHIHTCETIPNENDLISAVFLKSHLPELPKDQRNTMIAKYNISLITALQIMMVPELLNYFDNIVKMNIKSSPKEVANFLVLNLLEVLYKAKLEITECPLKDEQLAEVIEMISNQEINKHSAKIVLSVLLTDTNKTVRQVVEECNLYQITDKEELMKICKKVIDDNPKMVQQYKKKKTTLKGLLTAVAHSTNQRAHMAMASEIMKKLLH